MSSINRKCWLLFANFVLLLVGTQAEEQKVLAKDMKFKLHSGDYMPMVGFGTYQVKGQELINQVLDYALEAGYRLIDTAHVYGNEEEIGKALKTLLPKYNLKREDIFITSKLAPSDHGKDKAYKALESSLKKLDCGYLDLYLIHWPGVHGVNGTEEKNKVLRDESWQKLVEGQKNGLTKNIGVSNYNVKHIKELLANNHSIKPAVNQVEWHPHYHVPELLNLLKNEGILLQTYSSLGGTGNKELLEDPDVKGIASKLVKSPAQVLLRWALQQNLAIIPKARSKKHIEENIDLNFNIPDEDMKTLSNFKHNKYAWDPDTIV